VKTQHKPATKGRPIAIAAAILVVAVVLIAWIASAPLARMARERAISGLKEKFGADLQFSTLNVRIFPSISATGDDLVFRRDGRTDVPPLITIRHFTATANPLGALRRHISRVTLDGLQVHVPPRGERTQNPPNPDRKQPSDFVIDELIADGTVLTILPKDAWKEPLEFEIQRLRLQGAGPAGAMTFQAILRNARPPGDIHSDGGFGPWAAGEPGDTPVSGSYTFRNADLSVFNGISGILSSDGKYSGVLQHIEADGTTDTPDFTVKVSANPIHLTTQFHAIIDGTNGNTLLQPVNAQFGKSSVVARGGVEGTKGIKGKTVSLDVTAPNSRLEDMLLLGAKGKPSMKGAVNFHAKLVIPPGHVSVEQKIKLDGAFEIDSAHFSQLNVQEKVNKLSHSGEGDPKEDPGDTVASDFAGKFNLADGVMRFENLSFQVPGVAVSLTGTYGLPDQRLDFHGTARLDAKLSQTTTGIKSFLLKAVNPLFERKKAGAVLPIKITGTEDAPSFGLDLRLK
jgi:hypothetical protein